MTAFARRAVLVVALVGIAGWLWFRKGDERPSILLVTIDTVRVDRVGAYGATGIRTPVLDALAADGIRYDAAYATAPLTLPSHVSMLSGLLPVAHSVRTNDGYRVPDSVTLVGQRLQATGYRTAAFVSSVVLRRETGLERGFQAFDDNMGGAAERRAEAVAERTRAWLDRLEEGPIFIWVHLYDPHLPYDPPAPYAQPGRAYEGEIEYADAVLGRLIENVERHAGRSRLAVIVAADHGEGLGDHGERSHGALVYDETIRVPLIVRLPGSPRRGTVDQRPVTTAGIAATILALAGLPAAGLAASLLDPGTDPVVSESMYLKQQLGWSPLYAMRDEGQKAIDAPVPELYDLERDIGERSNVAPQKPDALRRLTARLHRELEAAARAGAPASNVAADVRTAAQLASLGYVSGGAPVKGVEPVGGVNPVERMAVWSDVEAGLERAQAGAKEQAAVLFERVLTADADNVLAMKFLGALAVERGELERGIALNERVLRTGLHGTDARRNLAIAYARQGAELARGGRTEAAISAYRRLVALDESNLDARERLGALLHRLGSAGAAREQFEYVLAREPHRRAAALSLAILLLEAGHVEDAVRRLEPLTDGWDGADQARAYLRDARRRLNGRGRP